MKRTVYLLLLATVIALGGCKKFLDVKPIDRLSDASFWKTKQDVEGAVADVYGHLFDILTYGPYIPVTGDMRAGEVVNGSGFYVFDAIGHNDLTFKIYPNSNAYYNIADLGDWYPFYQSIAECNIDLNRIPDVSVLSDEEIKAYLAEVRYVRAFTYFFISRIYGDVPLYTEPYDKTARARTPMVDVMKFCLSECEAIKDQLPWQYEDPTKWGVRASRGSVYALMANVNMWLAGFDPDNRQKYWKDAAAEVAEIKNSGYFELLPIQDFRKIFEGRSKESLFEFEVNANYGSTTLYVTIGEWTLHEPIIKGYGSSDIFFSADYLKKIYPQASADLRRDLWFYLPYANNTQSMFMKYSNLSNSVYTTHSWLLDDNLMIFRYGGILLLGAEAMANIGDNTNAITLLNMVRKRAGAKLYQPSDGDLKEFIFQERNRELIGEGVRWYDLVRTGRVQDPNECKDYLTPAQFDAGAWTWPIDPKARVNNPNIQLNSYWLN